MEPLDDPRIEALGMLIESHAEVTDALRRELAAACELPVSWLDVLIRLARTPGGELRMTRLAREMTVSTSGLTRMVDRIEDAGLVERRACPTDRRGTNVAITPAGRARFDAVYPLHVRHVQEHLARHLSRAELGTLTSLLEKVRDGERAART